MPSAIDARLAELGLTLPTPPPPVASYVPFVTAGKLVFVSGQICFADGKVSATGKLGAEVDLETGVRAARDCAINLLAQAKAACGGDLGRLARCVKLTAFVASAPGFTDQPKVVNGCSELIGDVMGDAGKHARSAVGVAVLPLDAAVEVEAIFELA